MSRRRLPLIAAPFALALLVALVWHDVLPGGWKLRGLVRPHALEEARQIAAHRASRIEAFQAENVSAPAEAIVFLGSSTIERFPLAESFPGKPCLDRGIGMESADGLLERLPESLPAAPHAAVVLYIGSVDLRHHGRGPDWIARRARLVVTLLRDGAPELSIAVIGVLPEVGMAPETGARLERVNALLAGLCAELDCAFVRTDRSPLTSGDGSLDPACAADRLHLNEVGYRHLALWLVEDGGATGALLAP